MPLFDIDYTKLINRLLPVRLRKPVLKAWLLALIAPVKYVYNQFGSNRENNLYYARHNSQVVYMQAVLNDVFDSLEGNRRIRIVDSTEIPIMYLYLSAENKDVYVYKASENQPLYIYTEQDVLNAFDGFIVRVPASLSIDTNYMSALIDKYRLPSKHKYLIVSA